MARFTWRVIWRSFASLTVLFLCVGASIPAKPGALDPHAQNRVGRLAADSTIVILLGTGTPGPDPNAFGSATAVVVGSRVFLFDAGVGVMRRMVAAKLPPTGPTALFITHLHSDHTLGYPDVILTSWVVGREKPLEAYGPHGLSAMTDHIMAAWKEDIDIRTDGLEHESPKGLVVHVHEIAPGVVYDSGGVKITAIPVLHGSWKEAYGYRIDTPDRSIVISGDTRPSPALQAAAQGVDVLIHEVHLEGGGRPGAPAKPEWLEYQRQFHTSDVELGRLAAAAQPKMLVLYHFGGQATVGDRVVASIHAQGYAGKILVGRDLDRF
jgi:ribonuclease BN (tRNA processing enzyme)